MPFIDFNTRKRIRVWDGITGPVYHSDQATFGHFTIESGKDLPAHSHPHEQWSHVIDGELEFTVGEETIVLTRGMTAFIPSNVVHSAKAFTECNVIDCFMPVREDFRELEKNVV
ncbi:MAG: cupin domain-containing protein [Bacteroidetes bacterium]|nr:MAG: cupin domain-containing protein [Bacteroidota bacterium]